MNVVKAECVNRFVAGMMIVDTVRCVKILFARPVADRTLIVREIWLVSLKNVLIHVKGQPHAVPME